MTVSTPLTQAALRREDERELFEALDEGLRCAEAAAGAIAYARQEGRWSQIKFLLGTIREKTQALRHGKQMSPLILPAGFDAPMGPGDKERINYDGHDRESL